MGIRLTRIGNKAGDLPALLGVLEDKSLVNAELSCRLKRGNLSGMWSRRIDQSNRLLYEVSGDTLMLHSAKDRYD